MQKMRRAMQLSHSGCVADVVGCDAELCHSGCVADGVGCDAELGHSGCVADIVGCDVLSLTVHLVRDRGGRVHFWHAVCLKLSFQPVSNQSKKMLKKSWGLISTFFACQHLTDSSIF